MKIEVEENYTIVLKEVFNAIKLESAKGEVFHICMRDDGFEFMYGGEKWSANNGGLWKQGYTDECYETM